jgi:formylglycine-generating enzyme required for sulfatase activity
MRMVEIAPGYFRRGSCFACHSGLREGLVERAREEGRTCLADYDWGRLEFRWTAVTRAFWISETEVTIAQYRAFDPDHETYASPDDEPVVEIGFEDAVRFCEWLSEREAGTYRLPMSAEWEYACRGGSDREYCYGDDPERLGEHAWFRDNAHGRLHPVKSRKPNAWGLYDMHGNAAEWTETLCPYLHPWIEWNGGPYSLDRREALEKEWVRRVNAAREPHRDKVEVPDLLYYARTLDPDLRGGSAYHEAHEAACGKAHIPSVPDYAKGFRLVWVAQD